MTSWPFDEIFASIDTTTYGFLFDTFPYY